MYKATLILALSFSAIICRAQVYDTVNRFRMPIQMDEVVVKASKNGFNVDAFIKRVRTDTSFYKAFKSLHLVPYTATNDIKVQDKKNNVIASLYSKTKQNIAKGCRTMQVQEEKTTGDFYKKNKDYNYYTAELYAYLFFTKGTICHENDIVGDAMSERGSGQLEKSKYQLKQLIFNPGSKVAGVPMMGDKAGIFDEGQRDKYDFKILSQDYEGQECYVFKVTPKAGEEQNVVYNELITWFRKSDYSIVARDYSLSFRTMFYDFDVRMKVRTKEVNNRLLPTYINYDGNWHVITKKRERVKFVTEITYL